MLVWVWFFGVVLAAPKPSDSVVVNLLRQGREIHTPAPYRLEDRAIGIADVGQVQNVVSNWGLLANVHFYTPSLHWPRAAPFQHQYAYGLLFFAGTRDNLATIHNRFLYEVSDWEPVEGALGRYHSGDVVNPDGWPLMATSTDTLTWPVDAQGRRFWPGPFRRDPVTGQEVPGEFTSDQDLYCVFDDRQNPVAPLGLEVHQIVHAYGRFYAEDFLIFRFRLVNTRAVPLDSLYVGLTAAFRVDFDFLDLVDLMDLTDSVGTPNLVVVSDADGQPDPPWTSVGPIGLAVLATPLGTGITDFHYYDKEFDPANDRELWPVVAGIPDDPDLADPGRYFHGPNPHLDTTPPAQPGAYDFLVAHGPFSLAPGDTTEFAVAVVFGTDLQDLLANARTAWRMKDKYYQGPSAPPAPRVQAYFGDGFVRLYWTPDPSETTPDPFTGLLDFEGYKIYRSEDGGLTWGPPIYDPYGNLRGYQPLAVLDLVDGIRGIDPANPYQTLGEDAGVAHTFVDSTVINGRRYVYAVTAFDRGNQHPDSLLPSLESPRGRIGSPNVVEGIPGPRAAGWTFSLGPVDTLQPVNGWTDALVALEILNPAELTGDTYELSLEALGADLALNLVDRNTGDTLLAHYPVPDTTAPLDALPITHGFRLWIRNTPAGFASAAWDSSAGTTFEWYVDDWGHGVARHRGEADFRLVISLQDSTSARWYTYASTAVPDTFVPVSVDTPLLVPLRGEVWDPAAGVWHPVDSLVVVDPYPFYPDSNTVGPPGWDLLPGGRAWPPSVTVRYQYPDQVGLFADTAFLFVRTLNGPPDGIPPAEGATFTVRMHRPLKPGLRFVFSPPPPEVRSSVPLRVRVVPNPFVLQSGFETSAYERKLMFTGLPPVCTIRIYTLAGDPVAVLRHTNGLGYEFWDLRSTSGLEVAYGLYLFTVEAPDGRRARGRFAVIR